MSVLPDFVLLSALRAPAVARHPLDGDPEGPGRGDGDVCGGVGGGPLNHQLRLVHDGGNSVGHHALVQTVVALPQIVHAQLTVVHCAKRIKTRFYKLHSVRCMHAVV